jgi:hypothetical protein
MRFDEALACLISVARSQVSTHMRDGISSDWNLLTMLL